MSDKFDVDYIDEVGFKSPNIHCHKYSELIFVLNGKLNFLVKDKVYHSKESSLIFFKENLLHTSDVDSSVKYTRYNITFRYKYLNDILEYESIRDLYESECSVIQLNSDEKNELLSLVKQIYEYKSRQDAKAEDIAIARHILCALLIKVNSLVKEKSVKSDFHIDTYINNVLEYIKRNISEKILIEDIADLFYVSRSKLMSDFKKITGITIGDYIMCNRIKLSKELLMSGKSVNETAVLSGFVNTSHFIRTFKNETGKTPLQYCRSKM